MHGSVLQGQILELVKELQDFGVFLGMFLESSIVPIPSELIIIGAGAIGIPLLSIVVFGSLGATLGGIGGREASWKCGNPLPLTPRRRSRLHPRPRPDSS